MRKIVLSALALASALVAIPTFSAPVQAESIYCGGSHERGIVPWRGQPGIGPYGVSPNCGAQGGGQRRGPVYYNGYRGGAQGGSSYRQGGGGMQMQAHSYTIKMCHDWVEQNGVKRYTGPAHAC